MQAGLAPSPWHQHQTRAALSAEMASFRGITALDVDRSGTVDAGEILSSFDVDGSGGLDKQELDKLASYLSSQVWRVGLRGL